MSFASSLVLPARAAMPARMIFFHDVACCPPLSLPLVSASYRLPDGCLPLSRLCHLVAGYIAGSQHPARLHIPFQPRHTGDVQQAQSHAIMRRVIDICKHVGCVGCVGYIWNKKCC